MASLNSSIEYQVKSSAIHKYCFLRGKRKNKEIMNPFYQKEYDIRLVASLTYLLQTK